MVHAVFGITVVEDRHHDSWDGGYDFDPSTDERSPNGNTFINMCSLSPYDPIFLLLYYFLRIARVLRSRI